MVQWYTKKTDTYSTLNLNTGVLEKRQSPKSGGVRAGNTAAETIKVIRTQDKRPRLKKQTLNTRLGTLQIEVRSPLVVTAKRIENINSPSSQRYSFKR